ncbi:MAG: hypothetical protein OEY59_02005 [Deltaproteobacteria bacterium]|nr:hypothetical protein [Deltaproteobacteria bacterium]
MSAKGIFKLALGAILMLSANLFGAVSTQAGEFSLMGGYGFTSLTVPTNGLSGVAGYRTDMQGGWFFTDYQLVAYNLVGKATVAKDVKVDCLVKMKSYEMNYTVLFGKSDSLSFGPGIGYGVAIVTEDVNSVDGGRRGDSCPFFANSDLHFGNLYLKIAKRFDSYLCEGRLSSFGGLIGGGVVCGITY